MYDQNTIIGQDSLNKISNKTGTFEESESN